MTNVKVRIKDEEEGWWKSPEEWRRLYPNHTFVIMNHDEWDNESFEIMPVEARAAIVDDDSKEIYFDTFRFNTLGWTVKQAVEFVSVQCFDTVDFVNDTLLEGWYD